MEDEALILAEKLREESGRCRVLKGGLGTLRIKESSPQVKATF
jgi:hypothetical protein